MIRTFPVARLLAALLAAWAGAAAAQAEPPDLPPEAAAVPAPAHPVLGWSAFGTLGWAQSNRAWRYQRHIDDDGTVRRDSVLGAQLDAQFSPEWSATLQARLAPSDENGSAWSLRPSWAFVAWRPDNNWLVRGGKLRVPFFLRSEHLDVGQTYDEARLPAELYTIAPTSDLSGAHVSHSMDLGGGELSVDVYSGSTGVKRRSWTREGLPPLVPAGEGISRVTTRATGIVLTWSDERTKIRAGAHAVRTRMNDQSGILVRPTWAPLGPGVGYWQTSNALPGPGVESVDSFRNYLFVLGGEFGLPQGWRVSPELVRLVQADTHMGMDAWAGALTVSRSMGRLTPYVSLAWLHSTGSSYEIGEQLESTQVPAMVPGSAMLNATMRLAADRVPSYRQNSVALGLAWALTPTSKLKAEWSHTRAKRSAMIDVPAGESLLKPRSVDVLSVNYSFVF